MLAHYISQLEEGGGGGGGGCDEGEKGGGSGGFQQSASYPDKPNPIKLDNSKISVKFKSTESGERPDVINTSSLWSLLTGFMDDTHVICNPSMKRCHVQFTIRLLREYLSDKTIHTFLTGKRVYPLMELLDRPRTKFEKKHHNAVGYFFSFILDKKISICNVEYNWSGECDMSVGNIDINPEGFWYMSKN